MKWVLGTDSRISHESMIDSIEHSPGLFVAAEGMGISKDIKPDSELKAVTVLPSAPLRVGH